MNPGLADTVSLVRGQVQQAPTFSRYGRVASISGLIVESDGPNVGLGELCVLRSQRNAFEVLAEVVGFRAEKILLMALGDVGGQRLCEQGAIAAAQIQHAGTLRHQTGNGLHDQGVAHAAPPSFKVFAMLSK